MQLDLEAVAVPLPDGAALVGELTLVGGADSLVIVAYASADRLRALAVARALVRQDHLVSGAGCSTLVLEPAESADALGPRIIAAADWAITYESTCHLSAGCLGLGPGASACLHAAAERPWGIGALVCCGRLVLAPAEVQRVRVPSLLIAQDPDHVADVGLLLSAYNEEVDDVTPDVEHVAALARAWFARHLGRAQTEHLESPLPPQ